MTAINYAQKFCTVADLVSDAQSPGVDEARMYLAIAEACEYLQKRIGWFIPVTLTHRFNGGSRVSLVLPYPLLSITSITNGGTSLVSTDYITKPDEGMWPYGPISELIVDPDAVNIGEWYNADDEVVVVGRWGMYSRSVLIGATVQDSTEQSNSQTTLKVSNGGKVSLGMVLLVGSEQELVSGWESPTAAVTTLNGAVAVADEYVTVVDAALVNIGETIRVEFEQMKVTDKNETNDRLKVIRSWNNTAKVAHNTATAVDVYRTVTVERAVNGTTAAVHLLNVAISRYIAPEDVQYLAKEIAFLIVNKAKSGYQGRTGNQDLGMVFYNDAFPEYDIKKVEEQYMFKRFQ